MRIISSIEILEILKKIKPEGLEVSTKMGVLSSSKAIYFYKELIYIFQIENHFTFEKEIGLTKEEFLKEYRNWTWKIEQIID